MNALRGLRSALAMAAIVLWLMLGGLYQRVFVYPAVFLFPRRRAAILAPYFKGMSRVILALMRAGGARLRRSGTIPTRDPVLVLMNHQSLLDILVLFRLFVHYKWVSKIENFRVPCIGWNMTLNRYIPLTRGKLQIQSEGAETFFRNIQIKTLDKPAAEY